MQEAITFTFNDGSVISFTPPPPVEKPVEQAKKPEPFQPAQLHVASIPRPASRERDGFRVPASRDRTPSF